jgi:hypothetical protein
MGENKRVAYSPGEFAELFGKSQTWGYRQIYAGKVNAITEHGRILIPAKEIERILEKAGIYNGIEKPKLAQARVQKLPVEQQDIWRRFVKSRRLSSGDASIKPATKSNRVERLGNDSARSRTTVLGKLAASWGSKAKS